MFMAVISNWLEMGFVSSRASTAEATASEAPFSSAETEAAGAEALWLAAPEEAAEDAEEAEPPQPVSRTQPAASAAAERTSFRRIFIEDFPLLSLNFQGPAAPKSVGPRPLSVYHNEVRIANELQDF